METPLFIQYSVRLFRLRLSGRHLGLYGQKSNAFWQVIAECRHYMKQNTHDRKRRGLSNREGSNNRRMRKFLATQDTRGVLVWPDYAIDKRDFG